MVAKIITGKSIRGALHYNENKVASGQARLLTGKGFLADEHKMSFAEKLDSFRLLTEQNRRTKTNTLHISLNFSANDRVDDRLLEEISGKYMEMIGFGKQPYLVYRHFDAAHPHIHIVTTNIQEGGRRIETHNLGRFQSEVARKAIEEQYGLIKAEDQKKEHRLRPVGIEKAQYGKSETKKAISNIVREVVSTYRFTSLGELNAALGQYNVVADRGKEGTRMFDQKGLVYSICDGNGNKVGVPIKASSIYSRPTLPNLEKRFEANKVKRQPHRQRLIGILEKALPAEGKTDRESLSKALAGKGIRAVFRENAQGRIYGVTFVDNVTRCVFNGSALGKKYSANATLHQPGQDSQKTAPPRETAGAGQPHPVARHEGGSPVPEIISGLFAPEYGQGEKVPYGLRKKKKRKKKTDRQ